MVKTDLLPWAPHHAVIVTIGTTTELTRDEEKIIERAYSCSPYGPYPELKEIVEEVRKTNPVLASKIIIPD